MDHRTFLATLDDDQKAALTQKSDRAGLLHLAGHVAILAALGAYIVFGLPFWQVFLVPYGIALVFLFTLEHEATHRTPFATIRLNDWVGRLCGVILILPFEWFRAFHLAHHKFTNDPENDPELDGFEIATWRQFVTHVSGLPYWAAMARQVFQNAFGEPKAAWLSTRSLPRIRAEARAMIVVYVFALSSLAYGTAIFWLWVFPVILGQPFLRLYLLAEHGRCPSVADMFENTRTTYTNQIVRFLAWNMPYHAEHHAYPTVPFWRLPDLHDSAREHLKTTAPNYAAFTKDYISDLKEPT